MLDDDPRHERRRPMYTPASDDEITGLVRYLDQQLDALVRRRRADRRAGPPAARAAARCRSAGCSSTSRTGCGARSAPGRRVRPGRRRRGYAAYMASFALADDETGAGALAEFDARPAVPRGGGRDRSVGADRPSRPRRGSASSTPGRRTAATTSCTRSRRWPATPATPTSSASRSTAMSVPADRAQRGGRAGQRLLPALRPRARHDRRPRASSWVRGPRATGPTGSRGVPPGDSRAVGMPR